LAAKGCVSLYEVDGKPYFWFPTWKDHQRIRDCKPKFPEPPVSDNLPRVAASCGELPQSAAIIQYESNTNTNPNPSIYTRAKAAEKEKHGQYGWVLLSAEEYQKLIADLGDQEAERCITYVDELAQGTSNKNKWKDWNLVVRRCSREQWGIRNKPKTAEPDYHAQMKEDIFGGLDIFG